MDSDNISTKISDEMARRNARDSRASSWDMIQQSFPGITYEGVLIALRKQYPKWVRPMNKIIGDLEE